MPADRAVCDPAGGRVSARAAASTLYDISRPISPAIAVWPGDQTFQVRWTMRLAAGDACNVAAVTMSVHTGTHADAPYHFDEQGAAIADVPLEPYVGPATVVEAAGGSIDVDILDGLDLARIRRVLFKTGASGLPESQWDTGFAYLTERAARRLADCGVLLVGTDAPSVDPHDSRTLAAHRTLARGGVAILESLHLAAVPPGEYDLMALPLRLVGLDASPVRAVLRPLAAPDARDLKGV